MSLPSRISSEWRRERGRAAFRSRVVALLAVLAVACAGLALAASARGPIARDAVVDPAALVAGPGGTVQFSAAAPLDAGFGELEIEPAARADAQVVGSSIVVRFATALDPATRYSVAVSGVRSAAGGPEGTFETTFSTPSWSLDWLRPGADGADDAVVRTELPSGEEMVLATAPDIRDFALLDGAAVVVAEDDDGTSALRVHELGGVATEELRLPASGVVEEVGVVGTVVLATFTDADPASFDVDRTLLRVDLAGDHVVREVLGLDGEPIAVSGWFPVPGTPDVVIAARDGSVVRYTPSADAPPTPLAQLSPVYGVSPDGSAVVAADAFGPVSLDLASGEVSRIAPTPVDGAEPFLGEVVLLPDGRRLAKAVVSDESGFRSVVLLDDGEEARILDAVPEGSAVATLAASPSGRYAVLVLDESGAGGEVSGPILVVDLDAGEAAARLPGLEPRT